MELMVLEQMVLLGSQVAAVRWQPSHCPVRGTCILWMLGALAVKEQWSLML